MFISDLAVKRPVFATVISALIVIFGLMAYQTLPLREMPKVDPPQVSVSTSYMGASAEVMERRVTQVIEDQLSGIQGVDFISSRSRDGASTVNVVFKLSRNLDEAANDVRDAVSRAVRRLPDDVDPPRVRKADSDGSPIKWYSLTSTRMSSIELTDYANRYIVRRLSVIDGIAFVRAGGGQTPAMRIWLDRVKLTAHGLTPVDIETALRAQNVELPAGTLEMEGRDFPLRVERGYVNVEDFNAIVVKEGEGGRQVRLGDVARVEYGADERRRMFRGNGVPMIGMGVVPQSNANQLEVSRAADREMELIRKTLPDHMSIEVNYDSTVFVDAAVREVLRTLTIAVTLVVAVIFAFLGSWRAALVPATVVPICLISAFIAIAAFGYSINLITLLALILCIGLVVDDAIVVLENISRRMSMGEPRLVAAYRGARQVGFAVVATTLVVIAAFSSLAFLEGFMGRVFRELAITISAAVAFSSLIALTLAPVMSSKLLVKKEIAEKSRFSRAFDRGIDWATRIYGQALDIVIAKPLMIFAGLAVLIGMAGVLFTTIPKDLEPEEDRGGFFMRYMFAKGASYNYGSGKMMEVENVLRPYWEGNEVHRALIITPSWGSSSYDGGMSMVFLTPWDQRERRGQDILREISGKMNAIPGVQAFGGMRGSFRHGAGGDGLGIVLLGPDYKTLNRWAGVIMTKARDFPGIGRIDVDYKPRTPKMEISVDKTRAADLGVTAQDIGRTVEAMLASRRVTTFVRGGEQYDVILQAEDEDRRDDTDLSNVNVRSRTTGQLIPLSSLISISRSGEAPNLNRFNRVRAVTISGTLGAGYSQEQALDFIYDVIKTELAGEPVQLDYVGGTRQYFEAANAFLFVFLMAMLIVYFVLAAQFESFIHPFVIMLTVPVAITGGLFALYMTGLSLNIYAQIGLVILVGLSAKNGILIVEFANQLRDQGQDVLEATIEASKTRLRPILMTGLSTAFGTVPLMLASGPGEMSRKSIGYVVFSGVALATILTLFIVPVIYSLLAKYTKSPGHISRALSDWEFENPASKPDTTPGE